MLTLDEMKALPEGARIKVWWYGTDGPFTYAATRWGDGSVLASSDNLDLPPGYCGTLCRPDDLRPLHRVEIDSTC